MSEGAKAYVDSSVLLSRYLVQDVSTRATEILNTQSLMFAARLVWVEVRRNLAMNISSVERTTSTLIFERDWSHFHIVEVDAHVYELAGRIAEETHVRTLDSIHLAAALSVGCGQFITFDRRQESAARRFGMEVMGLVN